MNILKDFIKQSWWIHLILWMAFLGLGFSLINIYDTLQLLDMTQENKASILELCDALNVTQGYYCNKIQP